MAATWQQVHTHGGLCREAYTREGDGVQGEAKGVPPPGMLSLPRVLHARELARAFAQGLDPDDITDLIKAVDPSGSSSHLGLQSARAGEGGSSQTDAIPMQAGSQAMDLNLPRTP